MKNLFDVEGKSVVITGGASGIGRALSLGFAQRGARVLALDIQADPLSRLEKEGEGRIAGARCDVSNLSEIESVFRSAGEKAGGVDVLINCAFSPQRAVPEELKEEDWERVWKVNVTGSMRCARAAGQWMIRKKAGSIIQISSIAGVTALGRGNFAYSMTKGAVNQMVRELAVEWARHGIRVNAILPCQAETPPVREWLSKPESRDLRTRLLQGIPMGRLAQPEDFVGPAVFLASEASAMVTGVLLPVDGGNLALNAGGTHATPV